MENLTKEKFKEKIFDFEKNEKWLFEGDKPAVVDFYADWCGPCKIISPILDELSEEYNGKVDFYKINTEEEIELISKFNIQSIPTLLFIPMDSEPKTSLGALPKEKLKNLINSLLNNDEDGTR